MPPEIAELGLTMILDLSNHLVYSQFLVLECEVQQLTHIVIGRTFDYESGEQSGPYSFYVNVTQSRQG